MLRKYILDKYNYYLFIYYIIALPDVYLLQRNIFVSDGCSLLIFMYNMLMYH